MLLRGARGDGDRGTPASLQEVGHPLGAQEFASMTKKMEEIFGVATRGDVEVGFDNLWLSVHMRYPEKVNAPLAQNQEVQGSIVLEWQAEGGWGIEITLYTNKPNDYYGIWISQVEEGPNIGKLEIGIQSHEDELEDKKSVQNDSGGYGFTKEEMKKKILELTGMDLNEFN